LHIAEVPNGHGGGASRIDAVDNVWSFQWAGQSDRIIYTRRDDKLRPSQLWIHTIGQPQASDVLLRVEPDDRFFLDVGKTKDDVLLTINSHSKLASEVSVVRAESPTDPPIMVHPRGEFQYFVEHHNGTVFILTTADVVGGGSDGFKLVSAPIGDPRMSQWKSVCTPPLGSRIEDADFFDACVVLHVRNAHGLREFLLVRYDDNDATRVMPSGPETEVSVNAPAWGVGTQRVTLPAGADIAAVAPHANSDPKASSFRFSSSTPLTPNVEWEIILASGVLQQLETWPCVGSPHFAVSNYTTEQLMVPGRTPDDPDVPVTVVSSKANPKTGTTPMLLCVYGAYVVEECGCVWGWGPPVMR
jgi:protease II